MKKLNIRNLALSLILILSISPGIGCELLPDIGTLLPSSPPATDNITPTDSGESIAPPTNEGSIDPEWLIPPAESQAPMLPSIADVVAKVKPSVVAINTEVITLDVLNRPRTREGAGSGWIIREDGIIITNNHVVEGAESITVTLDDGRTFPVALNKVATDRLTDLAVLKIDAKNLPAVQVGDSSKMRVGDWVVAIGNALGEGTRATQGIVSRQDVSILIGQTQRLYGLIETDAAINPGNSGGPLVNMAGEVIGITSAKLAAVEVEGTGYAISTEAAMPIISQLISVGYAVHPWLGVSLYPVDQFVLQRYDLAVDKGAFIVEVVIDSPAGAGGLQPEDVIVGFAGEEIETVDDLIQAIRSAQVGQEVEISYWRGESQHTTNVTLIERPQPF